jgi:hypothetical protein
MKFIKKTSWFSDQDYYESECEKYKIYHEDDRAWKVTYLGATVTIQGELDLAKGFIETLEEANYFKDIKQLDPQESRKLFYAGLKKDLHYNSNRWASVGYCHEPYHDITIMQNIDTKEFSYYSYSIGD